MIIKTTKNRPVKIFRDGIAYLFLHDLSGKYARFYETVAHIRAMLIFYTPYGKRCTDRR